jgi:hypothetical protein
MFLFPFLRNKRIADKLGLTSSLAFFSCDFVRKTSPSTSARMFPSLSLTFPENGARYVHLFSVSSSTFQTARPSMLIPMTHTPFIDTDPARREGYLARYVEGEHQQ